MIANPTGDFLTRIKNVALAGKKELSVPKSNLILEVGKVLVKRGYLETVESEGQRIIKVVLAQKGKRLTISGVKSLSRPGLRRYVPAALIPFPRARGIVIISTSQGIMSGKEAKKKNIGGELLGEVW